MIHLRTRLALTPCASATPATDAPRASHACTTRALNSVLWVRRIRFAGPTALCVRFISMVSTFFMVDTIGAADRSSKVGSPDAYAAASRTTFALCRQSGTSEFPLGRTPALFRQASLRVGPAFF